jgi:hypothetical protein
MEVFYPKKRNTTIKTSASHVLKKKHIRAMINTYPHLKKGNSPDDFSSYACSTTHYKARTHQTKL